MPVVSSDLEALQRRLNALTPRELAVARLRAKGHTLDAVAQELGISYSTAKNHVAAILRTMEMSSIAEVCYLLGRLDGRRELQAHYKSRGFL